MNKLLMSMVAIALLVAPANAALLVSYDFTSSTAPTSQAATYTGTSFSSSVTGAGLSGSVFSLGPTTTSFPTYDTAFADFTLTSTGPGFIVDNITFQYALTAGVGAAIKVASSIDGFSSFQQVIASSPTYQSTSFNNLGYAGNSVTFRFYTAGLTSGTPALDLVQVNGATVPEPASIAVFGLIGVGGFAVRRLRRKN
jgi:hypothetical protein